MLMYWGYIFPNDHVEGVTAWLLNIDVHGISCLLLLVEFALNDIKFEWKYILINVDNL
jgi:hypothetical protein